MRGRCGLTLAVALIAPQFAYADDFDALSIADSAQSTPSSARNWHAYAEVGLSNAALRPRDDALITRRLSFDAQIDHVLAPGLRFIAADRLDMQTPADTGKANSINTLKEAYLSWRASDSAMWDGGRVNVRNGVATGYNPTDYFRVNALRTIVSVNPATLKENRLGSVMARGQWLWDSGSVTALFAPKLASQPSDGGFDPDWGATNARDRALFVFSPKLSDKLSPQFLLYQEAGRDVQAGANVTALFNDATVGYLEWSGGRSPSSLSQALVAAHLSHADDDAFRNHVATGLTYTTSFKLSLTLEYQHNGSSLDERAWKALAAQAPLAYATYRQWLQRSLDSPSRNALFAYAAWQDVAINHLDLTGFVRRNSDDGSRMTWIEARYHWDGMEAAWQWQGTSGGAASEFGAMTQRRVWQVLLRYYL